MTMNSNKHVLINQVLQDFSYTFILYSANITWAHILKSTYEGDRDIEIGRLVSPSAGRNLLKGRPLVGPDV